MRRLILLTFACMTAFCLGSTARARGVESSDAAAVQRAAPAVVSISVWKQVPPDQPGGSPKRIKAYGSGFIIDPSGIVVTNKHVVDGTFGIKATLNDGSVASARLLAVSPLVDLAVLKVDVGRPLPSVEWSDSAALQVGNPVLTIGNALGWGSSVSAGIISGLNRNLMDSPFDSYLQTDASINHGNSGGPLINREGKVVGVDTALFNPADNGGFIGIGFAIPASTAKYVTTLLLNPNHVAPGWLGFTLQDLTGQLAVARSVPRPGGAIIAAVDPSGPAAKAGLKPGDVLEQLDGSHLGDAREFMRTIAEMPSGQTVRLTVWHAGKDHDVSATVALWPNIMPNGGPMTGAAAAAMMDMEPHPGVKLAALTEADRKQYGLSAAQTGVLITQVDPNCEASALGVVAGYVILAVQDTPVTSPDEVWNAVTQAHQQHREYLDVLIQTNTSAQWVAFSIN